VLNRLEALLPFFRQHVIVVASPHDGLPPELPEGATRPTTTSTGPKGTVVTSGPSKSAPGPAPLPTVPLRPVYASEGDNAFDVAALPHATGIKNLYLAGLENLPGLGLEGELVSAWGVVRLIAGGTSKRDPLRREVLINE
jgi:hypothetical protein